MVSVITFFVYLSTYYFTTIQNMQTDNERYKKMASLAQIGWWEVDLTAGYYLCSDYLSDLLGLDGDTISTSDFLNLIREDYRKQIAQEFRANSSIHKDFYEQTFPIHSKYGEVWLHTRLAFREKGTGVDGGDKSFGAAARYQWNRGGAFQPYVSAKLGAEYAKIRSNFSMLEARENSWGFYASPEVGINVFPWVYGPGLHFALYYSYGTNKADVLHYSVDGLSNFGFRLGVSF